MIEWSILLYAEYNTYLNLFVTHRSYLQFLGKVSPLCSYPAIK